LIVVREQGEVEARPVTGEGVVGVKIQRLIDPDLADSFLMRRFTLEPGGHTPLHSHAWEHEVYVLEGGGVVSDGEREFPLRPGSVVYVPPGQTHQFRAGDGGLVFLCLIPKPRE
jgi:quercetin dioxygenase-like cupin family protein